MNAQEEALLQWVADCRFDPLKFVMEGFEWGVDDLADWDGPDEWQKEDLILLGKELERAEREGGPVQIARASGHGVGKSTFIAMAVLFYMSTRPECVGTITANTERQLSNRTWRELAKWRARCITGHWFVMEKTKMFHVELPETWFVAAIPWSENNSEAFAGQHERYTFMIFDEGSAVANVIYEVASGAMTTPGALWLVYGNPTRNTGFFYDIFHKLKHRWLTRHIDSRTAKAADKTYTARLVEDHGEDSDYVRVRVLGQFPRQSASQFISTEIVQEAVKRELAPREYDRYAIVLGVDVARFGDDRTVLVWRQGPKILKMLALDQLDLVQVYRHVQGAMRDRSIPVATCFIDEIGLGAGLLDMCRRANLNAIGVNASWRSNKPNVHGNIRIDLWDDMREWMRNADIPDDKRLIAALTGPEFTYRANSNLLLIEGKKDMKRRGLDSPDEADAVALTFFAAAYELGDDDMEDLLAATAEGGHGGYGRSQMTGY
jgi:hypothetical protein